MNNENLKPARDTELLRRARRTVALKSALKWCWIAYFAVNIFGLTVWFFTDRGFFWPGLLMASMGVAVIMASIIISSILSGGEDKVNAEYDRLKKSNNPY